VQYLTWIGGVLRGDLGQSLLTGAPVAQLAEKAQVTIPLGLMAMTVALLIALPFGVLSAVRRGTPTAPRCRSAQTVAAVPVVWAGMMLVLVFAVWLGWLPAQGFPRAAGTTRHPPSGRCCCRRSRSASSRGDADAVRAFGDPPGDGRGLRPHGRGEGPHPHASLIRTATVGLSIITVLGLQVAGIIVGAVVIEQLFSLPGIGRMLVADVGSATCSRCRASCSCSPASCSSSASSSTSSTASSTLDSGRRRAGSPGCVGCGRCRRDASASSSCWRSARRAGRAVLAAVRSADSRRRGRWAAPGWPHLLGTDGAGRDILSLLMAGARTTVWVALGAGLVATVIGVALATLGASPRGGCGERRGARRHPDRVPGAADRHDDLVGVGRLAVGRDRLGRHRLRRQHRAGDAPELRRVLHSDFVLAGRAAGLTPLQNLYRHLLPNVAPVFIVQLSWGMAVAVLAEAGLSYLGFGAPLTEPSWGCC
jgi:ABC-type dipeptide/oligopeptide/nickel transport system permease component